MHNNKVPVLKQSFYQLFIFKQQVPKFSQGILLDAMFEN